jgi:hypothetical protein
MAFVGHFFLQLPQRIHSGAFGVFTGTMSILQTLAHASQPTRLLWLTLYFPKSSKIPPKVQPVSRVRRMSGLLRGLEDMDAKDIRSERLNGIRPPSGEY